MKTEQKLKIVYSFEPEIKPEKFKITDRMDNVLKNVAEDFGFKEFQGSGYNFKTKERDMCFIKKE